MIAITALGSAAVAVAVLARYAALSWVPDEAIDELPPILPCHRDHPETLGSNRPFCRIAARRYWLARSDADALLDLIALADDPNPGVRGMVAEILGEAEVKDRAAFQALLRLATDADATVPTRAVWSLGSFPCELLEEALRSLDNPAHDVFISAARERCAAREWRTCNGLAMRAAAEQREVRPGERVQVGLTLLNARAGSMNVPRPDRTLILTFRVFDADGVELPRTRRLPPSMMPDEWLRLDGGERWSMSRPILYEATTVAPPDAPQHKRMRLDFGHYFVDLDPGEYTVQAMLSAGMHERDAPLGGSADALDDVGWFGEISAEATVSLIAGD